MVSEFVVEGRTKSLLLTIAPGLRRFNAKRPREYTNCSNCRCDNGKHSLHIKRMVSKQTKLRSPQATSSRVISKAEFNALCKYIRFEDVDLNRIPVFVNIYHTDDGDDERYSDTNTFTFRAIITFS